MNRAQRRQLERRVKRSTGTLAHPVPGSVTLRGGPMDGWVVKPDAPALAPDWRARFIEAAAEGLHEHARAEARVHQQPVPRPWAELDELARDHYRAGAKAQHGGGRYVLDTGAQMPTASWQPE